MPRTTVNLEPSLLREIKRLAAESGESMSQAINRLVMAALAREKLTRGQSKSLKWHVAKGAEPVPGFDPASRDYLDLLVDR